MNVIKTEIDGPLILEPRIFGDDRGFFMETFRASFFESLGPGYRFVQDNHSKSGRGVLRGLHYQIQQPQGKLVRVVQGEVYDVAVDLRRQSPTLGRSVGVRLSAESKTQFWVPPGFAHGFLVLSETAEFVYKCTDYYAPEHERTLLWNDPELGIEWPDCAEPLLSDKDKRGLRLNEAELYDGLL
ncbi:dTDP-4-dehydrorhamnose 3,5-epimerase [Marinobacter sp. C2H3]|uniref:dTDP-4-dehydrorhamnose 3,5-epimerase n=1 Tax=Marinobacter sp. C2H3 TaxID=3119003 RepID=UPI00300EF9C3